MELGDQEDAECHSMDCGIHSESSVTWCCHGYVIIYYSRTSVLGFSVS